jgi:peptidoglycan hydrolase-like protein with peptidoglycan-binding domain
MQRETKDKIFVVVIMGAICLMTPAQAVAQTDRSGSGGAGSQGRPADTMPGSGTQQMERSAYPSQSTQGGAAMKGDDASMDLRGLPDPPETVRRVQQILKNEGYDPGPINGVLGPKTEEALLQYQQKQNIEATGWLDRETKARLGV